MVCLCIEHVSFRIPTSSNTLYSPIIIVTRCVTVDVKINYRVPHLKSRIVSNTSETLVVYFIIPSTNILPMMVIIDTTETQIAF